ncbi:MAG: hypothetical protein EXQ77_04820 [Thermoleophilia bacterium]|nr:hypothetical protein [Thermoleophilia bacterium]
MSGLDLDAEREIDLRSAWARITARWWLAAAGLVVGAVVGIVAASGSGTVWEANALLYLGQPFTPSGGGQLQSLQTNPKTVPELIRSERALEAAAKASGLTRAQLRGNVTSAPVTIATGATARNLSPLVELTVQAPRQEKAEQAAASLAATVIEAISPYVLQKIVQLEEQVATDEAQLARLDERIASLLEQQRQVLSGAGLSLGDRLVASQGVNANLSVAESQRLAIQQDVTDVRQLLSLAHQVELPRVVAEPLGKRADATSRRNGAVAGALLGLLLGAVAAYAVEPFLRRRSTS